MLEQKKVVLERTGASAHVASCRAAVGCVYEGSSHVGVMLPRYRQPSTQVCLMEGTRGQAARSMRPQDIALAKGSWGQLECRFEGHSIPFLSGQMLPGAP